MKEHNCSHCPLRKRHDERPTSLLGRIWRWHINFCPGWKSYFMSLSLDEQDSIRAKYRFTKYMTNK